MFLLVHKCLLLVSTTLKAVTGHCNESALIDYIELLLYYKQLQIVEC